MEEKLSFEENLKELEKIVAELEKNDCPLDKAIELFGDGAQKVKICNQLLSDAKLKIETISNERTDEND
ncbi:MAG: exodeoxyribonuclease VII small subunit [Clostridiales bacterium]|nr:exodeoxyribonuclease VII small subunit [Candidatus Equinaster intestinalis]